MHWSNIDFTEAASKTRNISRHNLEKDGIMPALKLLRILKKT